MCFHHLQAASITDRTWNAVETWCTSSRGSQLPREPAPAGASLRHPRCGQLLSGEDGARLARAQAVRRAPVQRIPHHRFLLTYAPLAQSTHLRSLPFWQQPR
jgi:hypothetical protein